MNEKLLKLSYLIKSYNLQASYDIARLAGRYDDKLLSMKEEIQPAYKYVMYLFLMRGLDESTFYHMKRKYTNTSLEVQEECRKELDKMINEDAINSDFSSAEIRRTFLSKMKSYNFKD